MQIIPKESDRRKLPTEELQKKLKRYIGNITPYEAVLENIIKEWGFNFPGWEDFNGNTYYGFYATVNGKTNTVLLMEYVDALAEEIIFIKEKILTNGKDN